MTDEADHDALLARAVAVATLRDLAKPGRYPELIPLLAQMTDEEIRALWVGLTPPAFHTYATQYHAIAFARALLAAPADRPQEDDPFGLERDAARDAPWPKGRNVGRLGDMAPPQDTHMRVLLDGDNDVCVEIWDNERGQCARAGIEFCTGFGGGKSPRTREALIAVMIAMEADNIECPHGQFPPAIEP